ELIRCVVANCGIRALDWSACEGISRTRLHLERHQGADRKRLRDRGDQPLDPFLVPNPTALEIRQLNLAVPTLTEKLLQADRVGLECRLFTQSGSPQMNLLTSGNWTRCPKTASFRTLRSASCSNAAEN